MVTVLACMMVYNGYMKQNRLKKKEKGLISKFYSHLRPLTPQFGLICSMFYEEGGDIYFLLKSDFS